jgi:SOS response regulatory protein OraA/RecX
MSKVRDELISILKDKHGDSPIVEQVIDSLYACGALDDGLMRRAVVYELFYDRLANSATSTRQVEFDLAFEYDMTRSTVQYIIRRSVA